MFFVFWVLLDCISKVALFENLKSKVFINFHFQKPLGEDSTPAGMALRTTSQAEIL